jgi:peptide deformylase
MNKQTEEFSGFLARVIQHEYDHLQGILFYEKLSTFKKTLAKNKLKKIKIGNFDVEYDMISPAGKYIAAM